MILQVQKEKLRIIGAGKWLGELVLLVKKKKKKKYLNASDFYLYLLKLVKYEFQLKRGLHVFLEKLILILQ